MLFPRSAFLIVVASCAALASAANSFVYKGPTGTLSPVLNGLQVIYRDGMITYDCDVCYTGQYTGFAFGLVLPRTPTPVSVTWTQSVHSFFEWFSLIRPDTSNFRDWQGPLVIHELGSYRTRMAVSDFSPVGTENAKFGKLAL